MNNIANKIYTKAEMRELGINTSDYVFMDEEGEFYGRLVLKAEARNDMIRLFIELNDGRKIITPVFWWQLSEKFGDKDIGTPLKFHYKRNSTGKVHLESAEIVNEYEDFYSLIGDE